MRLISHRGNIIGRNEAYENQPKYVQITLDAGFECEIDVWYLNGEFYLGHDSPKYKTDIEFLEQYNLWCHAKNIGALYQLRKSYSDYMNCFFHDNDAATLTSKGYIWTHCDQDILTPMSICVLPEKGSLKKTFITGGEKICAGICSDVIEDYRKCFE